MKTFGDHLKVTLSYLDMSGTEEKDNCRSAGLIGEEKN